MEHKLQKARCRHCSVEFEYPEKVVLVLGPDGTRRNRHVSRTVCPACRRGRKEWARKHWTDRPRALGVHARAGEFTPRAEIAQEMGLTVNQVENLERLALQKLRSAPKLRSAYGCFKEAGMPEVVQLIRELQRPSEAVLMERMREMLELWAMFDRVCLAGRNKITREGRLILSDVRKCHALLCGAMGKKRPS